MSEPSDELIEIAARLGWVADDGSEVAVTDRMKDGWRQVARDMFQAAHDAGLIVYRDEIASDWPLADIVVSQPVRAAYLIDMAFDVLRNVQKYGRGDNLAYSDEPELERLNRFYPDALECLDQIGEFLHPDIDLYADEGPSTI